MQKPIAKARRSLHDAGLPPLWCLAAFGHRSAMLRSVGLPWRQLLRRASSKKVCVLSALRFVVVLEIVSCILLRICFISCLFELALVVLNTFDHLRLRLQ